MNLLVIDWDYFTVMEEIGPNWPLYDWGHSESDLRGLFQVGIWPSRAAGFLRNDLPLPGLSGEEKGFWDRFPIHEDAVLYYADSNVRAFDEQISPGIEEIWLYDAHHDCGYRGDKTMDIIQDKGIVDCENWMIGYHLLNDIVPSRMHVRYPAWKTYAYEVEPDPALKIDRQFNADSNQPDTEFGAIFVCRSSAWTPPWLDGDYTTLIDAAPVLEQVNLDEREDTRIPRPFKIEDVEEFNTQYKQMMETYNAQGRIQGH